MPATFCLSDRSRKRRIKNETDPALQRHRLRPLMTEGCLFRPQSNQSQVNRRKRRGSGPLPTLRSGAKSVMQSRLTTRAS